MAIAVFIIFVLLILGISIYTGRKTKGAGGYFVANSSINWGVNGIAFAGSYLSVASFLGICGLIAFFGFDGFLYSIGFLAGWVIALFVIAEPMKRKGTFTFSDALNETFKRPGIQLAAGLSILVVSLFYIVPQMVGAGVLIEPLLGIPHAWGVILVGAVVILIVTSGGMTSTTYVQFFNGGLLLTFAGVLTAAVLMRGVQTSAHPIAEGLSGLENYEYSQLEAVWEGDTPQIDLPGAVTLDRHATVNTYTGDEEEVFFLISQLIETETDVSGAYLAKIKGHPVIFESSELQGGTASLEEAGGQTYLRIEEWFRLIPDGKGGYLLEETQSRATMPDGTRLVNGIPEEIFSHLRLTGGVDNLPEEYGESTGPVGPLKLLSVLSDPATILQRPRSTSFQAQDGAHATIFYEEETKGSVFMQPGLMFPLEPKPGEPAATTVLHRLNFISLLITLFLGTAALPHILIRYYTVPDADAARKSTIVAIAGIGLFYILTMYLGVGAISNSALNPESNNMSAPLLARSFGEVLFAIISGIAFTTVLATMSGLIMAASGAVAHDLLENILRKDFSEKAKVLTGRIVSVVVGVIGIILGISFREMNVSFLVGWAFAVAASANLPSLIVVLFWKKATADGIIASILTGIVSSVGLILLSPDMWARYGLDPASAPMPLNQPGIISIPLSFIVLVAVSLWGGKKKQEKIEEPA